VEDAAAIARMPDPATESLCGVTVPLAYLDAREPSAPAKLRRAMQHLGASPQ
jgi:hypothetical protein